MSQPNWKQAAYLGDASPLDYGGVWVFEDKTGVYDPEMEIYEPNEDENKGGTVYRLVMEKCTYIDGVLSDNKFHPDHPAWFANRIGSVADSCDHANIINDLCSEDIQELACAWRSLVLYFGAHEFDHYPLELTQGEARRRYKKAKYSLK